MAKKVSFNKDDTRQHIILLLKYISEGIFEKENILAMSLLCAVAGESIFLLGPPGTAKSLVARRLKLVFKEAKSFEYLMSRFSTPDEIFGPVSISKLKNEDKYERITDGYLPNCTVVFLDEIWKAGPAIQNALLTVINERIYKNGSQTLSLPMKALIAASNELPAENEGLEALWDRFLVRMVSNCISDERTFFKMIRQDRVPEVVIPDELLITDDTFASWQSAIAHITISDETCTIVANIRKLLKEEEKKQKCTTTLDFYVSDRRWKKLFHLMRTSAWLNGRVSTDETDCILLIHCLWNKEEFIAQTIECVMKAFTLHIEQRITKLHTTIDKTIKERSANMPVGKMIEADSFNTYVVERYFYYVLKDYPKGKCLFAKTDFNHLSIGKDTSGIIYIDSNIQNWIIHAIYMGTPFNSKLGSSGKVEKVSLRKCKDGIVVNGTPYAFLRKASGNNANLSNNLFEDEKEPKVNTAFQQLQVELSEISNIFNALSARIAECTNLFVSDDDKKLISQQIKATGKLLNELYIKLNNSQMLL